MSLAARRLSGRQEHGLGEKREHDEDHKARPPVDAKQRLRRGLARWASAIWNRSTDCDPFVSRQGLRTYSTLLHDSSDASSVTCGTFVQSMNVNLLATAVGNCIKLWDYHEGILSRTLQMHSSPITCIAVATLRKSLLLSYSIDQTLLVWDLNLPDETNVVHTETSRSQLYHCIIVTRWTSDTDLVIAGSGSNKINLLKLSNRGTLEYLLSWKSSVPVQSLDIMTKKETQYVVASVKNQSPAVVEVWNITAALRNLSVNNESVEDMKSETPGRVLPIQPENLAEVKNRRPSFVELNSLPKVTRRRSKPLRTFSTRSFPAELTTPAVRLPGRHASVARIAHFACQDPTYKDAFDVQFVVATDASDYKIVNVWKLFIHSEQNISSEEEENSNRNSIEKLHSIQAELRPFDMAMLNTPKPLLVGKLASLEKWQVWDVELGTLVRELEVHSRQSEPWAKKNASYTSVICSSANMPYYGSDTEAPAHIVVTYSQTEKSARVWDLGIGPIEIMRESARVADEWCVISHPTRPRVVMPSMGSVLNVKDFVSGKQLFKLHNERASSKVTGHIVLSTTGAFVAAVLTSLGQSSVMVWRLDPQNQTDNVPREYEFEVSWTETPIAIIDDLECRDPLIVFGDQNGRIQGRRFIGDQIVLYAHKEPVNLLRAASAETCSNKRLLVSATANTIIVYDVGAGSLLYEYQDHRVCDLQIYTLNNVPVILAACRDNSINVWDLQSGEKMFAPIRNVGEQQSSGVSLAGLALSTVVCSSDGGRYVKLWELSTGRLIKSIEVAVPNMQVKKIIMTTTRKSSLLVILEPTLESNAVVTFAQAVSASRHKHIHTAQVWDISNHLCGMGSLNSISSTIDLDLLHDPNGLSRSVEMFEKYPGCMLGFRLDALAQRSSPLVLLLKQGYQKLNIIELVLTTTPQAVACFVPVLNSTDSDVSFQKWDTTPSLVVLFLEILCRRLKAVQKNVDETIAMEADADIMIHLLSKAWNSSMARDKHPSLAYMTLLACYLDVAGIVRNANLEKNKPYCHFHLRFITSLNIFPVVQVQQSMEQHIYRQARNESMRNLLVTPVDSQDRENWVLVDKEKSRCYLLPIENNKAAMTETLKLVVEVSRRKDPTKIFCKDIPDALICCNWDAKQRKSVFFTYNCFIAYYCFFVVLFTSCNAWFFNLTHMKNRGQYSPKHLAWGLQTLVIISLVPLVFVEIAYLHAAISKANLSSYASDPWNFLVWVAYVLTVVSFGLRISNKTENDDSRICLALATVIVWCKLLWLLRAWKKAGPAVAFVYRSSFEMRWYLVVLFVLVIGFAEAFYLLNQGGTGGKPFQNSWNSIFSTFVFMLGNPDANMPYETNSVLLTTILVTILNLLTTILVVNMIIAKMTETFHNVHANMLSYWRVEQAKIILEMYSLSDGFSMMLYPWLRTGGLSVPSPPTRESNPLLLNFVNVSEELWDERGIVILKNQQGEALEALEQKMAGLERKLDVSLQTDAAETNQLSHRITALESKLDIIIGALRR